MASISTGQAEGGKRAVDHEIPLVPFIDLLLCCIMFLLVTAVWNQLASIQATAPGPSIDGLVERTEALPLNVRVTADGYRITSEAGDDTQIPLAGTEYDVVALREHLAARHRIAPNEHSVVVTADDGISYASLMLTMDTLVGEGFESVSVDGTR